MSLNATSSGERIHITFFGRVNAGKSSLINAFTGQQVAIASDRPGTTTDPVKKAMELLPLGPVLLTDTPGLGDETELGDLRMEAALKALSDCDMAILVIDGSRAFSEDGSLFLAEEEELLLRELKKRGIPYIQTVNKADTLSGGMGQEEGDRVYVSALTGSGIDQLKARAVRLMESSKKDERYLIRDMLSPGDHVILVMPIDESAPKGRLILPQQLVMRDILDGGASFSGCQPSQLPELLSICYGQSSGYGGRKIVVTDSQAFGRVSEMVPESVDLTSFSILMARYKGELSTLSRGAGLLKGLRQGDRVLIAEACTHHRQCNDIGTVKLPGWIEEYCGEKPEFEFVSGGDFPPGSELGAYKLIVHCGACMINEASMKARLKEAEMAGIPMVNYGTAIACIHGILDRSLKIFKD